MASDKQVREIESAFQRIARQEIKSFLQHQQELKKKLQSGMLCYAVEWWEQDCLEIDENAHLLFIFLDGTEHDEVLHRQIRDKLSSMLADAGISWEYSFRAEFSSNILYPAEFAGQPYYEKVPQQPKKWRKWLSDIITFNINEQWIRRKDLP